MTRNTLIETARQIVPNPSRGMAFVYFLRLRSGKIYVGCTIDHLRGAACYSTKNDLSVELLRLEPCADFTAARRREAQLKKWSGQKKEALVRGNLVLLKQLSRSHD
jgi:putative endonuclease